MLSNYILITDKQGLIELYVLNKQLELNLICSYQTGIPIFRSLLLTPQTVVFSSYSGYIFVYESIRTVSYYIE